MKHHTVRAREAMAAVASDGVRPGHNDARSNHDATQLRREDNYERNMNEPCEATIGVPEAFDAGPRSCEDISFRNDGDLHSRTVNGEEHGVGETYIRVKRKGSGFTGSLFNGVNALTGRLEALERKDILRVTCFQA